MNEEPRVVKVLIEVVRDQQKQIDLIQKQILLLFDVFDDFDKEREEEKKNEAKALDGPQSALPPAGR